MPYLEGPASHLCHGFDSGPDSRTGSGPDRDAPDGTSDVSSVVSWAWEAGARAGRPSVPAPEPHPDCRQG